MLEKLALSSFEACEMAGISRSFLYKKIAEGNGPRFRKVGNRTLILKKDLEAWLESMPGTRREDDPSDLAC